MILCDWMGHDYQCIGVTAEGHQLHACVRCGAKYETWASNSTTTDRKEQTK